jgi:hypothetical protein
MMHGLHWDCNARGIVSTLFTISKNTTPDPEYASVSRSRISGLLCVRPGRRHSENDGLWKELTPETTVGEVPGVIRRTRKISEKEQTEESFLSDGMRGTFLEGIIRRRHVERSRYYRCRFSRLKFELLNKINKTSWKGIYWKADGSVCCLLSRDAWKISTVCTRNSENEANMFALSDDGTPSIRADSIRSYLHIQQKQYSIFAIQSGKFSEQIIR